MGCYEKETGTRERSHAPQAARSWSNCTDGGVRRHPARTRASAARRRGERAGTAPRRAGAVPGRARGAIAAGAHDRRVGGMNPRAAGTFVSGRPRGPRGQRQLSLIVVAPPEPVVYDRFGSDSQVTEPSGFFLRYLYWNAVFAGSGTVADHVG